MTSHVCKNGHVDNYSMDFKCCECGDGLTAVETKLAYEMKERAAIKAALAQVQDAQLSLAAGDVSMARRRMRTAHKTLRRSIQ